MIQAVRSASAFLFYLLGSVVLVLVLVAESVPQSSVTMLLHILDLPLLLIALVYGGTSLIGSTGKGRVSSIFAMLTSVILLALFLVFAWFNFGFANS